MSDTDHHLRTAEDYRKAIAALEASTLAIESQISISRQLLETISTFRQQRSKSTTQNKHQTISTQISSQHTALAQDLTTTSANLKRAISSTLTTVDDTLSRDDYTFEQIAQSLSASGAGSDNNTIDDDDNDSSDDASRTRTEQLLNALIRTESEVIRTRLERVYLEVLHSTTTPTTNRDANYDDDHDSDSPRYIDPTKTEILKSDLRTLYAEIDDVTALFVAHEHGDVLSRLDEDVARTRQVLSARQSEWTVERIREMTGRLRVIEDGLRNVQGQRVVVRRLSSYLDELSSLSVMGSTGSGGSRIDTGPARKEMDGPALVGLRGYLGVGATGESRGDRIDEIFMDVTRSVEGVLNVRDEQAEMLRGTHGEKGGNQGEEGLARGYGPMLDSLDEEIARVKEGIETSSG